MCVDWDVTKCSGGYSIYFSGFLLHMFTIHYVKFAETKVWNNRNNLSHHPVLQLIILQCAYPANKVDCLSRVIRLLPSSQVCGPWKVCLYCVCIRFGTTGVETILFALNTMSRMMIVILYSLFGCQARAQFWERMYPNFSVQGYPLTMVPPIPEPKFFLCLLWILHNTAFLGNQLMRLKTRVLRLRRFRYRVEKQTFTERHYKLPEYEK